jgi:cytochrome c-type biogenesis protein CcsB
MDKAEVLLLWIVVFGYVASFCLNLFAFLSRKTKVAAYAINVMWLALIAHTACGIIRWINSGHPPVTDTYELNLTGMWFAVLIFVVFEKLQRLQWSIALVVTPIVILVLGYGYMSPSQVVPMGAAYRSPWLVIHVIFAWLSFGCYAVSTGAGLFLLLKEYLPGSKRMEKIPEPQVLDDMGYRFIAIGFINHGVMLASGAIWAKNLWGQYWSWDPLETWSLIAFLFYAFYLHTRAFLGWKMKRAAWLALFGLVVMAISFWGVQFFTPQIGRIHPGP